MEQRTTDYYQPHPYAEDAAFSAPRKRRWFHFRGLPTDRPVGNILLFLATLISTYLTNGLWYSVAILSILLAHEMGHYLMCRRYGVPATLPFFIPFPLANPFGTMGAVIQMKGVIPSRQALFDIGAAGPLAGLVVTLPVVFWGLEWSAIVPVSSLADSGMTLGESVLFKALTFLTIGPVPDGYDVMLHPVAYAGWAGLFVTALNLLPIGQLDGGHIVYAMLGPKSRIVTMIFIGAMVVLTFFYTGWALLVALLILLGRRHPSPWDDWTPLDKRRKLLGIVVMILFVLSFTPMPFKI
ncbi:MAG TPA: site-2 protease family protein [bacterium]|nr:site-2 protease family protein [bacterium]HPN34666.1 site-2 protease family protein [bacterium]